MPENTAEQELLNQLKTDKRSLQIQAIVKLARFGKSEQTLKAIIPFMESTDREISFFATQTAGKIAKTLGVELKQFIKDDTSATKNLAQTNIVNNEKNKTEIDNLLKLVRERPQEIRPEWLPSIGTFLTKYGSSADAEFIKQQLLRDNSNLCLPFLNAAEKFAKPIMPDVLPNLLASRECLVRSRAISILQKLDPAMAEQHFTDLLASRNAENRLAGIGISMMFPFEKVRTYLITLLSNETDKDVISACQTVLVSNPSLETALNILDTYDTVPKSHKNVLSHIFKFVCKSLEITGMLSPTEATPENIISQWKNQRLQKFLDNIEIRLSLANKEQTAPILDWLEQNRSNQLVENFIRKLEFNPQTENIYRQLSGLPTVEEEEQIDKSNNNSLSSKNIEPEIKQENKELNTSSDEAIYSQDTSENYLLPSIDQQEETKTLYSEPGATNPQIIVRQENNALQEIQQDAKLNNEKKKIIKTLKSIELENAAQYIEWVFELVKDYSEENAKIKAEAINAMVRAYRGQKLIEIAKEGIKSEYEPIKVASFKALERTSPDYLKANLSAILKDKDENIRVRAVRFAIKVDLQTAINCLKKMLSSNDDHIRANAISCLALCPFEHTAKILIDRLSKETHPVIAKQIISIIQNNPSLAMLETLERLSNNSNPEISMLIAQARNTMEEVVPNLSEEQKQKNPVIENALFSSLDEKDDNPYSIANVRAIKAKQNAEKEKSEPKSNKLPLIIFIIGLVCLIVGVPIIFMNSPTKEKSSNTTKKKITSKRSTSNRSTNKNQRQNNGTRKGVSLGSVKDSESSLNMNVSNKITATVEAVLSETSIIISYNNVKINAQFNSNIPKSISENRKVLITIVPYSKNGQGIIQARGQNISLAK